MDAIKAALARRKAAAEKIVAEEKKYKRNGERNSDNEDDESSEEIIVNHSQLQTEEQKRQLLDKMEDEPMEGEPPLPVSVVIGALRDMGEPATLFAETPWKRFRRYKQLELRRSRQEEGGAKDDFGATMRALEDGHDGEIADLVDQNKSTNEKKMSAAQKAALAMAAEIERQESKIDYSKPDELSDEQKGKVIVSVLKRLLSEWGDDLKNRDDAEAKSAQGNVATATYVQCANNIKPLFQSIKNGSLHHDILRQLFTIAIRLDQKEYVRAHDAYILLAIGNAAWPMGVTMVGIHERAGRSKIFDSKTAHILNDETQRKYIQSVKRLMTFAQNKHPTRPSQMVRF